MESQQKRNSKKIPVRFKKYFWDCDFMLLNFEEYDFFIIERIINFGNMDSLKWLLSMVDYKKIKIVVEKSRNLNRKTRNYWKTVFDE